MIESARYLGWVKRVGFLGAAFVAFIGLGVTLGWILNVRFLEGAFSLGITVKTNTGICFLLAGGALGLELGADGHVGWMRLARILAGVMVVIGVMTLSEHLFGWNLHIDELLFREAPGQLATTSPNRMGIPASTSFLVGGLAILLLRRRTPSFDVPSALASTVALIAIFPTLGYLFGASELYGISKDGGIVRYTGIALPTAVTMIVWALAIICANPRGMVVSILTSSSAGGVLVRRLLVPAILIPPLLGYLRTSGEMRGYYDAAFGRALLIVSFIVIFVGLIWGSARRLEQLDRARRVAADAEKVSESAREATEKKFQLLAEERQRLLISERAAREEAERASKLKDEFLTTLSHELRTPLNAILGWSQILESGRRSEEDLRDGISAIHRNARAQTALVEDLLDMSRILTGKLRIDVAPLNLAEVVSAAVESVLPTARAKDIRIDEMLTTMPGAISGDPSRLQQVVWNLLSNAVKFTPKGGRVQVTLARVNSHAEITVSDTGQGIGPEFLPHLFERFRQADSTSTRRHGGLGLGLALAKQLVELHGGTVRAESPGAGAGATFTVSLPIALARAHRGESGGAAQRAEKRAVTLAGFKVLVVDDEPDAQVLARRILETCDASVFTAGSAAEAMELLKRERPDVLVSDIGMPDSDGYDLIRMVRSLSSEAGGQTPAAALTAFARSEDRQRCLLAGYQSHVSKPVEPNELIAVVASLIGTATARA